MGGLSEINIGLPKVLKRCRKDKNIGRDKDKMLNGDLPRTGPVERVEESRAKKYNLQQR